MRMNLVNGLVETVPYVPSPNCNDYPDLTDISLLVVHGISLPPGQFEGTDVIDFFTNNLDVHKDPFYADISDLRVSAHFFVRRDGQAIQFVSCRQRAWHAGESMFEGRPACNDYSIGIELEGTDTSGYTDAQYHTLVQLTVALQDAFPKITRDRIVGHSDIAPGRKTDPGVNFAWQKYFDLLDYTHQQLKDIT